MLGFCVSLGNIFFSTGMGEVDENILPHLSELAGSEVMPRVLPSYSMLYWFATKVRPRVNPCRSFVDVTISVLHYMIWKRVLNVCPSILLIDQVEYIHLILCRYLKRLRWRV